MLGSPLCAQELLSVLLWWFHMSDPAGSCSGQYFYPRLTHTGRAGNAGALPPHVL